MKKSQEEGNTCVDVLIVEGELPVLGELIDIGEVELDEVVVFVDHLLVMDALQLPIAALLELEADDEANQQRFDFLAYLFGGGVGDQPIQQVILGYNANQNVFDQMIVRQKDVSHTEFKCNVDY